MKSRQQLRVELAAAIAVEEKNYPAYVASLPLLDALWWFIEEHASLSCATQSEIFFALRARMWTEKAPQRVLDGMPL